MPGPLWLATIAAAFVLAIALHRAARSARRWREEAERWRALSGHQTRVMRSAWMNKCGPDVDRATADRIVALLERGGGPDE